MFLLLYFFLSIQGSYCEKAQASWIMMNVLFQTGIIALFVEKIQGFSVSAVQMLFALAASRMLYLQKLKVTKGSAMIALN